MIRRLKKIANVFKPNKFHFALVDYLAEELKSNNISCRKKTSYIKIKLASKIEEKYDHLIIDCFNGGIYLRGDEVRDKKILKLNRFYGDREADAMHCARGGAKSIIKLLSRLQNKDSMIVEATDNLDDNNDYEERTANIIDMRKTAKKILKDFRKLGRLKKADINGRDFAISIINGKVYTADVHGQTMSNFLKDLGITDIEFYDRYELEDSLGKGFIIDFAAAHAVGNKIYIEPDTLMNMDLNEAINILSNEFKGYEIYNANTKEKIAKNDRLRKIANHSDSSRDTAVCFINGEFYEGDTHAECIDKYLEEHYGENLNDTHYRPDQLNLSNGNKKDNKLIDEYIKQMAFAHLLEYEKTIYIEESTLQNIDINTAGKLFKENYPEYDIYNDDSYKGNGNCDDDYDEDGNNKYEKIARLRKLATDIEDRDFEGAIVYIDGEVYTARTHATAINNYIQEKLNQELSNTWSRPNLKNNDNLFLSEERIKDKELIKNNIKQLGFAHKISKLLDVDGDEDIILVEQDSLYNVDLNTVVNAIKNKYPNFNIYIDETDEKVAKKVIDLRTKKIGRLKKESLHDINNRDKAIVYIDGEVLESRTHAKAINDYLYRNYYNQLSKTYSRPEKYKDNFNGYYETNEDKWDQEKIDKYIDTLAFAHEDDKNKAIYIEQNSLQNVDINTVSSAIKNKYPDFNIYIDETDEKLAKNNKLKKLAWHDVSDRDNAIAYIDGEIVEAETHAECVSIYLEDEFNLSLNGQQTRPNVQIEVDDAWDDNQAQDLQNIYDNIKQICFGHVDNANKTIYLEPNGLNVSANDLTTIGPKIKEKFPDFNIVIDNAANENFKQVARLKKKAEHDTMNRDCAIVYVNGEFYQGNTHAKALNKYLNNSGKKLNETKYRPFFNVEPKSYYSDNDIQDINTMNDTKFEEVAFAHEVKNENAIYIEQYSLQNIDIETAAKLFKEQYPSFDIYNDDTYNNSTQEYQLIAKNKSRLKKLSGYHDKNNRTSAIMYLDGEVLEGSDHYDMITEYMKEKYNLDRANTDQERETDNLFDSLSYAMGSKVDEDKTIYIDDDTLNNVDGQVIIDAIKAKYPGFNVIIETSSNEDMREYYKKSLYY